MQSSFECVTIHHAICETHHMLKTWHLEFKYHKLQISSFQNLLFFFLCDIYIQSYRLSKLKNKEKYNNFKSNFVIPAKLPRATYDGFTQNASHIARFFLNLPPVLSISSRFTSGPAIVSFVVYTLYSLRCLVLPISSQLSVTSVVTPSVENFPVSGLQYTNLQLSMLWQQMSGMLVKDSSIGVSRSEISFFPSEDKFKMCLKQRMKTKDKFWRKDLSLIGS